MSNAKRPLPSLRFAIYERAGRKGFVMALIPQTTPRGKVLPNLWAMPGGGIENTETLIERCKRCQWHYEITGSDDSTKRRPA